MNTDIASSALSPKTWPFSIEFLPPQACLVGGAVRDALLGRRAEYLDLDFVLPTDSVKTGRKMANKCKCGFVVLDAQRQIARVVFKQATVDLALQDGDSLETDLQRRDFTINAIAYNPHTQEIIDPLQGVADLQVGLIRMVCQQNLREDPLRLLRAYRQASQLGFTIEAETKSVIPKLAPLAGQVAAERVRVELSYLFKSAQGTPWLQEAWEDKLLPVWFPHAQAQDVAKIALIDNYAEILTETWPQLGAELQSPVAKKLFSLLSLAKLACLVPLPSETAEESLRGLKYTRAEVRAVGTALRCLPELLSHPQDPLSLRQQFFFFREVGSFFPIVILLALAEGICIESLEPLIERYLNSSDQVAHPQPLVTGKELMQAFDLPAGSPVGWLLTEIQIARIEGKIDSREAALELAALLI
ncbi:MAG: CCA tRNA nucleotidyltransferase [Coleofasciculaceae cyanobacterium]